jgi:hypothetical protein
VEEVGRLWITTATRAVRVFALDPKTNRASAYEFPTGGGRGRGTGADVATQDRGGTKAEQPEWAPNVIQSTVALTDAERKRVAAGLFVEGATGPADFVELPVRTLVPRCSNQVRVFGFSRLQSTHKPSPSGEGISLIFRRPEHHGKRDRGQSRCDTNPTTSPRLGRAMATSVRVRSMPPVAVRAPLQSLLHTSLQKSSCAPNLNNRPARICVGCK